MTELDAFKLCNFCPECGTKLELLRIEKGLVKQCKHHPLSLYVAQGLAGFEVIAYDPNRAIRLRKRV